MSLINQEFQNILKNKTTTIFIYKHKIAFYLLSEQQYKLYEGFKKGFELAQQKMSNHIGEHTKTHIYH